MKQTGIQFLLFGKRLWKRPVYLLILLLMPLTVFALSAAGKEDPEGIRALLYSGDMQTGTDEALDLIVTYLLEKDGTVRFEAVESEEALMQAVLREEADCGYIFKEDFGNRLAEGDWKRSITLYCGEDPMIPMLVNELLYTAVFREYSENTFVDYMGTVYGEPAGNRENAEKQAADLLNIYLTNGSTFSFHYYGSLPEEKEAYEQAAEKSEGITGDLVPVRGLLAVLMMLSAFCGLIDYQRDKEAGRLVWVRNKPVTECIMIMLPILGAAVISLFCLAASGNAAALNKEIACVIIYTGMLTCYAVLWGVFFRSEHAVVASMPFLMIAVILFCPVFWNLKAVLPVFGVMEKLFPVTWYLGLF